MYWVDVFHLGAAAVIFVGAEGGHRKEAEQKFLDVPADLPRFYAAPEVEGRVLELAREGRVVRLRGSMSWRNATGKVLVGVIPGRAAQLGQEAVLLNAYYDAMSPVPALAPGAEQACSVAALLEIVEALVRRPPRRTVLVVLTAGHFENLAGMRYFAPLLRRAAGRGREEDQFDGADRVLVERLDDFNLRLFVGLDLSSGSELLGAFKQVQPYRLSLLAPPLTQRLMGIAAAYEDSVLGGRRLLANGLKQDLSRQGLGGLPQTIPFDASVAALVGCPALTFCTINDSRARVDSPVDRPAQVDYVHLASQVRFLEHSIGLLVDDGDLEPWDWGVDAFGTVRGEVVHYGPRSYLPDQPTTGALVRLRLRNPTLAAVRPDFWATADDSGHFVVPGVETRIIYTQPLRLEAYQIEAAGGKVIAAPDWGINGERRLPGRALTVNMDDWQEEVQVVTAAAAGLTLFETFDPRSLTSLEHLAVIDAITEAEPSTFGACLPLTTSEIKLFDYKNRVRSWIDPITVLFARPGTRIKVVMANGRYGLGRRLLLLNGGAEDAKGSGYLAGGGARLAQTGYHIARDMYLLNDERIAELEARGVRNDRLVAFHQRAAAFLQEAETAGKEGRHRDFLDRGRRAWAYAAAAYGDVAQTQRGVVQGALFLLAALLPFAHFAERLFCGFVNLRRQVIAFFSFFLLGFLALKYLHPAFELTLSPVVILLGFTILALALLVMGIGISRLNREMRDLAQGHRRQVDVQRAGIMLTALAVGLAHLRRRPLRTGLTCATLVLLTFSIVSFTSIRTTLRTNRVAVAGAEARYDGALVRLPGWQELEVGAYRILRDRFGTQRVAPRAWLAVASLTKIFRVERADKSDVATGVLGIAGLTAQEKFLVAPQEKLLAGRWLQEGEEDACLLPRGVADSLGIVAGDVPAARVRLFGELFRVVGLLAEDALDAVDLNGESLTPLDPEAQQPTEAAAGAAQGGQTAVFNHLPANRVIVLPYAAVMRWEGALLASVGVQLADEGEIVELAETLDLDLFVGRAGQRFLVNTVGVASVSGLGQLIVPLAIAALIVLNTMLGAVFERVREIGVFNAVGLAPAHVSSLFLAEALALGVVGAVLGYLLGQAAAQVLGHWGLLAGLQLNYSSLAAVTTLGLVVVLVLLSTLYPAHLAGKICTPGIERRWRPPAPEGDVLQVELPFTLGRQDALGMAAFQAEFWEGHQEQSIGAGFYVEQLKLEYVGARLRLQARVWLAPFDRGVSQDAVLDLFPGADPRYYHIEVKLRRVAGEYDTWRRVNRTFLDDLRKQFLVWRTLALEDRLVYIERVERKGA